MGFPEQLAKLRKRKKIKQTEFANMLGVKQYVISSWEIGRSEPSIKQIVKICDILDVPADYLLDRSIIRTASEEEFNKTISNINQDIQEDFTKDINNIIKDFSIEKKTKVLNIIKELSDF